MPILARSGPAVGSIFRIAAFSLSLKSFIFACKACFASGVASGPIAAFSFFSSVSCA